MVSRRAHEGEGVAGSPAQHCLDSPNGSPCRQTCGIPRINRHIGVGVKLTAAVARQLANLAQQMGGMDGFEGGFGCGVGRAVVQHIVETAYVEGVADRH